MVKIPLEDTDVLWKPPRMGTRMRTISTDSADSAANEAPQPHRRFSISEFFGIRRPSVSTEASTSVAAGVVAPERRGSITEVGELSRLLGLLSEFVIMDMHTISPTSLELRLQGVREAQPSPRR